MSELLTISFDLDGTLLCEGNEELADPQVPSLFGPSGYREDRMRLGALPLLKSLATRGHPIWIYTQSLRGKGEVTAWFENLGVPLAGYVNLALHEIACEKHGIVGIRPKKCPHLFGIDVHVDDDEQIARECSETSCRVILIKPEEVDFEGRVRRELNMDD